jgi:hypothetical protein
MDPEQDFIPKVKGVAVASDNSVFLHHHRRNVTITTLLKLLREKWLFQSVKSLNKLKDENISHRSKRLHRFINL